MSDKLLPCPFCGPGQSQVDVWHDDVSKRYRVGCGRCGCSTGIDPRDKSEAPAIAAWNKRPDLPAQLAAARAALATISESEPQNFDAPMLRAIAHNALSPSAPARDCSAAVPAQTVEPERAGGEAAQEPAGQSEVTRDTLIDAVWAYCCPAIRQTPADREFYGDMIDIFVRELGHPTVPAGPQSPGVTGDVNYKLPCDVRLPPVTTIRKGCDLGTLLRAIKQREGYSDDESRFTAHPTVKVSGDAAGLAEFANDLASKQVSLTAEENGLLHKALLDSSTPAHESGDAAADETAWLIELRSKAGVPTYHQLEHDNDWTADASRALRFARREDAQAYIEHIGWTEPKPVEHMWCAPRSRAAVSDGEIYAAVSKRISGDAAEMRERAARVAEELVDGWDNIKNEPKKVLRWWPDGEAIAAEIRALPLTPAQSERDGGRP